MPPAKAEMTLIQRLSSPISTIGASKKPLVALNQKVEVAGIFKMRNRNPPNGTRCELAPTIPTDGL